MIRVLVVFLLFALNTHSVSSQNLVKNPGLEMVKLEPAEQAICRPLQAKDFNEWVIDWNTFQSTTPDWVSITSQADCPAVAARSGQAAVGFYNFHPYMDASYDNDYHEFVQGRLVQALEVGATYEFSVWVQLNNTLGGQYLQATWRFPLILHPRGCNNIGIRFSTEAERVEENYPKSIREFGIKPHLNFTEVIDQEGEWVQLRTTFTATGPWRYFVMGNYFTDAVTARTPDHKRDFIDSFNLAPKPTQKRLRRFSYFLADDFYVGPPQAKTEMATALRNEASFTFKHLQFDSGKASLRPGSTQELDELASVLQAQPTLRIRISGHTDDVGSAASNQALSQARAAEVGAYLTAQGIDPDRYEAVGFGESQPIAPNTSSAGRAKNRRVEVSALND